MDASYSVMFGLPGPGALLRCDPLSLFFCAILLPQVVASSLAGMRGSIGFWLTVVGMALTLLAGTPFMLVFGAGWVMTSIWCMVARADTRQALGLQMIMVFVVLCLVAGLVLPSASPAFVLVLIGTAAMAGLAPFYNGLPRTYAALPEAMSAVMSGGTINLAFYILIRFAFMTKSGWQQPWWGEGLMVVGALSVLVGALKAALEADLKEGLNWSSIATAGLIAIAIGIALQAKALDHPALTGLALQAALLFILAHSLFKPLLLIGAGEVKRAVGTTSLNWLGGLMRGMPRLGGLMLLGALGMAALPLGPAFAPVFLLVHAVIGAAMQGTVWAQLDGAVLLAVIGLGMGLLLLAALKIIGFGFLGRPRSLHAAAAEDALRGPFLGMVMLGILCLPVALVPEFVLFLCAPVIHALSPLAQTARLAYSPLTLCLLAGLALVVVALAQIRWGVRGLRETPAWNGGFGAPPVWLPFGDPHTQSSASGFVEPLNFILGRASFIDRADGFLRLKLRFLYKQALLLGGKMSKLSPRRWLAATFVVCLLVLWLFALAQGG